MASFSESKLSVAGTSVDDRDDDEKLCEVDLFLSPDRRQSHAVNEAIHLRLESQRAEIAKPEPPGDPVTARKNRRPAPPALLARLTGKKDARAKGLLTLAEALNDDVPRACKATAWLWRVVDELEQYGVEAFGIERTLSESNKTTSLLDIWFLWFTGNFNVVTIALGAFACSVSQLNLAQASVVIIVFNVILAIPFGYLTTFGARTGLRQMVFSRFSFGYYPCIIILVLNVAQQIGWSTINIIVGAQTLRACSDSYSLPIWAGVVILATLTLFPPTAGLRQVMWYMRWAWIPPLAGYIALAVKAAPSMDARAVLASPGPLAPRIFECGMYIGSFALGWVPYASDYAVRLPERTSTAAIFAVVYTSNVLANVPLQILGAALVTSLGGRPDRQDEYDLGTGYLIGTILREDLGRFGGFLTVLIGMSIIANNVPNLYSFALTMQTFHRYVQAVPRVFITLAGSIVYSVLAAVSGGRFDMPAELLLSLLSYWLASYVVIIVQEHVLFRAARFDAYELDEVHRPDVLPVGLAGLGALAVGFVGALLGMNQPWWSGPIARSVGGDDVGLELSTLFCAFSYPVFRVAERAYFGR